MKLSYNPPHPERAGRFEFPAPSTIGLTALPFSLKEASSTEIAAFVVVAVSAVSQVIW